MIPRALMPKTLRDDYIRVVMLDKDNHEKGGMCRLKDGAIVIRERRYRVDERVITRSGLFRVPTIYYLDGNSGPIDLRGRVTLTADAGEEFDKMESHIASDALKAFSGDSLMEDKRFLLLLMVIGGGLAFLYYNFDKQFKALESAIAAIGAG